jgi:hypothetical protein
MTRFTFTFLLCACASFALRAQDTAQAVLKFTSTEQWLYTIHEGDVAEYKFRFVNAGSAPLVILEVREKSLTPDSPKAPVAPGDSGFIVLRYATSGKPGTFDQTATVRSNNAGGDVVLHLKGYVKPKPPADAPVITFDSATYWFDTVYQGSLVEHEFRFTNTGKSPLVISIVQGSSGSVVPSYPKEPIAPGESGMIRVIFHTGGKMGPQEKTVTVTSNASEPNVVLRLKGVVIPAPPIDQSPAPVKKPGQ